ncbi:MAG: FAD-dependent oxidoreductase [Kiritimatiellia bacterium]
MRFTDEDDFKSDIVVVGGGAAGLTAALSAARNGADTVLIDNNGFLGGLSTTLPWLGFHDRDYRLIVKGLPLEFVHRLQETGAGAPFEYDIKCGSAFSFDSHMWKCIAMQMCVEAGVKVLFQTRVTGVLQDGNRVTGVIAYDKSGFRKITAPMVIDCSGDGDVAAMAGAAWKKGRDDDGLVQTPTLVFKLGGVDRDGFIAGCRNDALNYREWLADYPKLRTKTVARLDDMRVIVCGGYASLVEKARKAGDIDLPQTHIVGVKLHRPDEFLVVMTRVLGLDPVNGDSINEAYYHLYRQIPMLVKFFRKYVPGFGNSNLREIASVLGVRESRRITGEYTLTENDLVSGRVFDDAVCMGAYHIDIHRPAGTWVESKNVKAYTVPLRSLIVKDFEGLMVAGKCFSATHEALASTRVVPVCMGMGEAAGVAAVMALSSGCSVRELDVGNLQNALQFQGVELGRTLENPNAELIDKIGQLPLVEDAHSDEYDGVKNSEYWLDNCVS